MKAEESSCPECGAEPGLYMTTKFVAKDTGAFSLAGGQLKTAAELRPVVGCRKCHMEIIGTWDPDGLHANFPGGNVRTPTRGADAGSGRGAADAPGP